MKRGLLLFAVVWTVLGQGLPVKRQQEIEKLISQEMARQSIPAMSVAVAAGGELIWSSGFGLADVENFVPAKASTVYRLGSISKPITAVAALQLYESGKLELDAPVQRYVPTFPRKPWPITIRQLLGHLSGIRHYEGSLEEVNSTRHYRDLPAALRIFQGDPLLFEPGTKFHYTTYGYVLLGTAIESASQQRFLEYLRQRVFGPSGMDRIRQDHVYAIIPNRARGYALSAGGQLQNCSLADTSNKTPGGGLASTVEDLVRLAIGLRKGALLRPSTLDLMWTPQRVRDGHVVDYGLGWQIRSLDGRRMVAHTGGQQGVSTILAMLPRENVAVALMCNLEKAQIEDLAGRIVRQVVDVPASHLSRSAHQTAGSASASAK